MSTREEIINLLKQNSRLSNQQMAKILDLDEAVLAQEIQELEEQKVILAYTSLIDESKVDKELVTAMIHINVAPEFAHGYDEIAKKVYSFPEVTDCYLLSGSFDLMAIVKAKSLREVAVFVSSRIASIKHVTGTNTHFILQNYKKNGINVLAQDGEDREAIVL